MPLKRISRYWDLVNKAFLFYKTAISLNKKIVILCSLNKAKTMKRGQTGNYEIINTSGETVRAFVPVPLPPEPPIEWNSSRQKLLERATLA